MKKTTKYLLLVVLMFIGVTLLTISKTTCAQTVKELKLQSHLPASDINRGLPYFATMLEKLTGGRYKVKLYPVGAIVPAKEMLSALRAGTLDIVHYAEGYFSGEVPGTEAASGLPMLFDELSEAWYFMWYKGVVDILRDEYAKKGAYFIPWEAWPTALMTRKPVKTLDDLKGMKLRSWGGIAHLLTKCGASVTFIPGGELYTALATGVVDGAHWDGAGPMFNMRFHEVLKYLLLPYLQYSWNNLLINKKIWDSMSPEDKIKFLTAAQASAYFGTMHTRVLEVYALEAMVRRFGVKVNMLPDDDVKRMQAIAVESWDEIAKRSSVDAAIVQKAKEMLKEKGTREAAERLNQCLGFPW
ncbi:MAG: TRAP transporter substrate-binding protein DctP [Candidatus Bathyarchaeia archaeon]